MGNKYFFELITKQQIQKLCETRIFDRGLDYYHNGSIRNISAKGNEIHASVEGSEYEPYKIIIKGTVNGIITYASCTCPYDMGGYCKHIIAVLLALLDKKQGGLANKEKKLNVVDVNDIKPCLKNKSKNELVDIILEQSQKDDSLLKSLALDTAIKTKKSINPGKYKRQIQFVFQTEFLKWNEVYDFVQQLEIIKDGIDKLIEKKYYREAKEILEYFIEKSVHKIEDLDDSNGEYSPFVQSLYESYAIVVTGCEINPEELAKWVFNSILGDGYGFTDSLLEQMEKPLGDAGYSIVEKRAREKLVERFSQIAEEQVRKSFDYKLSTLKNILTDIAKIQKDDEKHLEILELFLGESTYSYVELCEKLVSMGRNEEAIKRLNEGLQRYSENRDSRLNDMLSKLYEKQGNIKEAFKHEWERFKYYHDSYNRVKQLAKKINNWDETRENIIRALKPRHSRLLIELYIEDGAVDKAINEIKTDTFYGLDSIMVTAKAAENNYPNDSIIFYRKIAEIFIAQKNNESYSQAKKIIRKIKELYNKLNDEANWNEYINQVRIVHKAKKNLMRELLNL